ncbi:hypothetical protein BPO_1453 [Bergeyella porcorum]|uniref:MnmG N-terminal domain-containing protein n=1 Tax=Bergeyella porcorum TaxID=1735111 RepID=A0AAU0F196_9FLAO
MVKSLIIENNCVAGVVTSIGVEFRAKSLSLPMEPSLMDLSISEKSNSAVVEWANLKLWNYRAIVSLGFDAGRMKTGTPVRVDGRSIDFSKMEEQKGDENPQKFSYLDTPKLTEQRSCYITYTNETVHEILREGLIEARCSMELFKVSGQDIAQV